MSSKIQNLMNFCDILNSNGIYSPQYELNSVYRNFEKMIITFRKDTKIKRLLIDLNTDYMLFDRLFTILKLSHIEYLMNIVKYIDKRILSSRYLLKDKNENEVKENAISDDNTNFNEYLVFRLKIFQIEYTDIFLEQLNVMIRKKFKKHSKCLSMVLNIIPILMQDANFKFYNEYIAYNELIKSKILIVCLSDDIYDIEFKKLLNLNMPMYIVSIDFDLIPSSPVLIDRKLFENNKNAKFYDIGSHEFNLSNSYITKQLIHDLKIDLNIVSQVSHTSYTL